MPRCAVNSIAPSTTAYSTAPSSSYSRTGRSAGPESTVAQPSSANVSTSRCDCEAAPDVQVPERSSSHAPMATRVTVEHTSAHARIAVRGIDPAAALRSASVARKALRLRVARRQAASLSWNSSVQTVAEPSTSGGNSSPSLMNTTAPDGPCERYGPDTLHVSPVLPVTVAVVSDIFLLLRKRSKGVLTRRNELLAARRAREQRERRARHALVRNVQVLVAPLELLEEQKRNE